MHGNVVFKASKNIILYIFVEIKEGRSSTLLPYMDLHEISELDQKSLHKQHTEKSELLNTIHYDYASLNFCECEFFLLSFVNPKFVSFRRSCHQKVLRFNPIIMKFPGKKFYEFSSRFEKFETFYEW